MSAKKIITDSGIEIKEIYTEKDNIQIDPSLSGEFPFTRGVQSSMYRGKLWTMRQYAGFLPVKRATKDIIIY